jgi:hypothetical protein
VEALSAACMAATKKKRKILLLSDIYDPKNHCHERFVQKFQTEATIQKQY